MDQYRTNENSIVRDEVTGEVGELMYLGDWEDPSRSAGPGPRATRLAFLRPPGGGREWTTDPARLTYLAPEGTAR